MNLYQTSGHLTGTIQPENVATAMAYLREHDMTQFLDEDLEGVVVHIEWVLNTNGHTYLVVAKSLRELTDDELKSLADWTSGQNSDGLGEGFEQQEFAELDGDCGECDDCQNGYTCDESYYAGMISFDWQKNDSTFVRVS